MVWPRFRLGAPGSICRCNPLKTFASRCRHGRVRATARFPPTVRSFAVSTTAWQSISSYATVPDQLGVTVLSEGRDLRLFSTNRATITAARARIPDFKLQERVILSTDFCQQLLRLNKDAPADKTRQLAIRSDHALFVVDGTVLFGLLVAGDNPLDFVSTVARHLPAR